MLGFVHKGTFYGPNPYSREPVVIVDLAVPETLASRGEAIESRITALHGWTRTEPLPDVAVDEAERIARLVVHWAFAALNHTRGYLHAFGWHKLDERTVRLWLGFHQPGMSLTALKYAVDLVTEVAEDRVDPAAWEQQLEKFGEACRYWHPDYQTRMLMEIARAVGIPCMPAWGKRTHWQFGWGARSRVMRESASDEEGHLGAQVINAKDQSKEFLVSLGLPTPDYALIREEADIARAVEKIGFPCVTKPLRLGGGRGITTGLSDIEEVRAGFAYARAFSPGPVMLEGFAQGEDTRIMVIDGCFTGAFRRHPPAVTGDGESTIRQLIERANAQRSKLRICDDGYLDPIRFDNAAEQFLAGKGMSAETVLPAGESAIVRGNSNLSTGGHATDVTGELHPDIARASEAAARTLKVRVVGFDYMSSDIGRNWEDGDGAFIEMNLTPGIDIMTVAGRPKLETVMSILGSEPGRIPLDVIVIDDGQMGEAQALVSRLTEGPACGWASHDEARLGGMPLRVAMRHPWAGVMTLLGHRVLESAWLVVTSSELRRLGFPVDRADRIHLCANDLPEPWLDVFREASANPLWQGQLRELPRFLGE
ncbi:MAG: ATP-grasp domain-containing protein [Novosphingobium sp.]|nr:ATP-grasp domain-containing protein [Novosphingobium sp.]MCP5404159.1 ATP-grasp domain-containing protein [Novosphingobium sp.]